VWTVAGLQAAGDRGRFGFNERERPPESGPGVVGRKERQKKRTNNKKEGTVK
jgi:hypothetical protein